MDKEVIIVPEESEGKRLDLFLALSFNKYSRTQIKKSIESDKVLVNGGVEYRANYKVKEDDKIELTIQPTDQTDKIIPENIPLDIIYEDTDLIVINKPAGIVVHPATGNWTGTVMNALLYHYRNLKNVGEQVRSGLIHRLDKDTSGLLLIGKTNKGLWHYSKLFSTRDVEKSYIAVTSGYVPNEMSINGKLEVKNYLGRNKLMRKKMSVVADLDSSSVKIPNDARMSHTVFSLIDSNDDANLYLASPKTGRTHQIRVHSSYINTPIIGDKVYGGIKSNRMLLHAFKLSILSPEGQMLEFKANPDDEFVGIMNDFGINTDFKF